MSYIRTEGITKRYGEGDAAVTALRTMNFQAEAGEFVAIMGESGSGKSTLLSILGALNTPSSGRLFVDEIDVYGLGSEQRADFRREFLGFVFQSFYLVPYLTVQENVMLPLATLGINRKRKQRMAEKVLEWMGIANKSHRLPGQISGGEKERVAVARAIVNSPSILLADEPTGSLDSKTTREMMTLLGKLHAEGMTIVMVTHSQECADHAQRIVHLSDGMILNEQKEI